MEFHIPSQSEVFRSFKTKGLSISADATKALLRVLEAQAGNVELNPQQTLQLFLTEIRKKVEKRESTPM